MTGANGGSGEPGTGGAAWDPDDYDGNHSYVYEYGADVLDLLSPVPGERILDVGCGTGHLTAAIAGRGAEAVGVDASEEMVLEARETRSAPEFVRVDARRLAFEAAFDAAFSNAALHWIPGEDQDAVLQSVHEALRLGGRFVGELGGAGNVAAVVDGVHAELAERGHEMSQPWYFPTVGEYALRLEENGFEVRSARLFDRPTELDGGDEGLANWLEMFGDGLLAPVPAGERPAVVAAVEDRLRPELYDDGAWTADYRRLRFEAVRQ